jgi:predicted aconitase
LYLTREEERILAGQYGSGMAKSLELLVALGEVFGAEKLVPIESAHVSGVSYKNLGDAGLEWLEDQAKLDSKAKVRATLNPAGMDMTRWREMNVPEKFAECQLRAIRAFEALGIEPTCTCTPYLVGNVPRPGSQIAWAESSAICYANSVLGARTNRESGPTTIASAITGLTPLYEYRIDENRLPGRLIEVEAKLNDPLDYSALGYVTGKLVGANVPYFRGLGNPSLESLKTMGAALATSGSVALWHGEGVTPEAENVKPHLREVEKITIEEKNLKEVRGKFTCEVADPITCIGCPHCSLHEVGEVAKLVKGKHVGKKLCVFTSRSVHAEARRRGYVGQIEEAGGGVYVDTCMVVAPLKEMGWKEVALNSFKGAQYSVNMGLKTRMGTARELVREVLK